MDLQLFCLPTQPVLLCTFTSPHGLCQWTAIFMTQMNGREEYSLFRIWPLTGYFPHLLQVWAILLLKIDSGAPFVLMDPPAASFLSSLDQTINTPAWFNFVLALVCRYVPIPTCIPNIVVLFGLPHFKLRHNIPDLIMTSRSEENRNSSTAAVDMADLINNNAMSI